LITVLAIGAAARRKCRIFSTWIASAASHHQGFDGPASGAEISVNLETGVHRVGRDLGQSGFGVAYRAQVAWIKLEQHIGNAHVPSFRSTLVQFERRLITFC
jgi:hypothetical protein